MLLHSKKFFVLSLLLTALIAMSFKTGSKDNNAPKFKNLQVLPKDISHDDLVAVMKGYCVSLGVKCGNCHVKIENSDKLDFASDDKDEKQIARKMITMANEINKTYFGANTGTIGCMTCHNGKPNPTEANKIAAPGAPATPAVPAAPADSSKH